MTSEERKLVWERCVQAVFPDMWEWQEGHNLVIHFPKLTISNELELTHEINNLFIKFPLYNDFNTGGELYGLRFTFTIKEFLSSYTHSHLEPGFRWRNFCLGSSEFGRDLTHIYELAFDNESENRANCEINEEFLLGMFLNLDAYIKWESLEGGPYKKIEELNDWGMIFKRNNSLFCSNYSYTPKDIRYYYNKLINILPSVEILPSGHEKNIQFKVSNDLSDYFNHINEINCLKGTNKLIPATNEELVRNVLYRTTSIESVSDFKFKGQDFKFEITDLDTFSFKQEDLGMPIALQQQLIIYLNEQLNKTAKKYFLTPQEN